jgi:hypothetical protein
MGGGELTVGTRIWTKANSAFHEPSSTAARLHPWLLLVPKKQPKKQPLPRIDGKTIKKQEEK